MRRLKRLFLSVTILFVASVGVALGSGYWLGALSVPQDDYVKENLWLLDNEVTKDDTNGQWIVTTTLENRGLDNTTIVNVYIDEKNIAENLLRENVTISPDLPILIKGVMHYSDKAGKETITATIRYGTLNLESGITIEMRFHTNAGMDYPISVTLP